MNLWTSFNWEEIINELELGLRDKNVTTLREAKLAEQRGIITKTILSTVRPKVWEWYGQCSKKK